MKVFENALLTRGREDRIVNWTLETETKEVPLVEHTNSDLLSVLNRLGQEGWEVVSKVSDIPTKYLLKRQLY